MGYDEDVRDRLKGLEVKINGNGDYGLEYQVGSNKKKLEELDEKVDNIKLTMVSKDVFDSHIISENQRLDRLENRIIEKIEERIKRQSKYWVRYLGPILTGIAAILAVILGGG